MHGPFGKIEPTVPLERGGTAGTSAREARANLDVPSLSGDNVFTGTNEFGGATSFQGAVNADNGLTVVGALTATSDPATIGTLTINNNLTVLGYSVLAGVRFAYVAKTANYTAASTDCVIDATSGTWTLTLPAAATAGAGRLYIVKNSGAGTITLATTGGDTIDGALTQTLAPYNSITVVSTGSAWIIV